MPPRPPVPPSPPPPVRQRLRESAVQVRRALGLVYRSSPAATLALAAVTLVRAVAPPLAALVGKLIVDAVLAAHGASGEAREAALGHAFRLVALEFGILALDGATVQALNLLRTILGARLAMNVNVMILEKALTLELRHFEDATIYDKLVRARREASHRPLNLIVNTFAIGRNLLTVAGYIALLVSFSPVMVVGLLAASLPAFASQARFAGQAFRLLHGRSPESRQLNYLEHVLSNDRHAKEVKLFGLGPLLLGRYRDLAQKFFGEDRGLATRRTIWSYSFSLLSLVTFYAAYAVVVAAAGAGRITIGEMTLYVVAFRQTQDNFNSIFGSVSSLYEDVLYLSNLFEFLALPTDGPAALARTAPPRREPSAEEGIRFEGVGFRYPAPGPSPDAAKPAAATAPPPERWALRNLDLVIPKGQSLALVGENGAGKTTFIKLLTGLYQPTEGRVLLDGRDLLQWDEAELRRRIGVIFQDFAQYQLRVRENVGFGSVPHAEDESRVARAIERGGAGEVVGALGRGIDTQLGRWFHEGVELSGGQWQKIALARAFMREEADILILDEPTAALDAAAEHAIFERFRALAAGRTTILISHRFSTVRMADRILVLEHGRVLEDGSHAALLAAGGRYAELFTLQARGYQ